MMTRHFYSKGNVKLLANTRFDPIAGWFQVRRDLFNSSVLNKEDWDITLSSGIEVRDL